jgi:hypothetical protein
MQGSDLLFDGIDDGGWDNDEYERLFASWAKVGNVTWCCENLEGYSFSPSICLFGNIN